MKTSRILLTVLPGLMWPPLLRESSAQSPEHPSGQLKVHLDMRGVISEGRRLRMGGASVGWEWGARRDEATLGYYWTGNRGRKDIAGLSGFTPPLLPAGAAVETDIRFLSGGYWMTVVDRKRWKLAAPMELGFGRAKFTGFPDQETGDKTTASLPVFPAQVAAYGEWKASRWVGLGLQTGYRHYFTSSGQPSLHGLSGPYYRIRVLVYIQTFYDWRNFIFRKEPLPTPFY